MNTLYRLSFVLITLTGGTSASAQLYPPAPAPEHSGWPPATLRTLPAEPDYLGYPFDAVGEFQAPDGDYKGLYLELDHEVGPVTYMNADLLWSAAGVTGIWVRADFTKFGTWQSNVCFGDVTVIHFDGTTEQIFEVPHGLEQSMLYFEIEPPSNPPPLGQQATISFKTSSTQGGTCPLIFLVDDIFGDWGVIPTAAEPQLPDPAVETVSVFPNPARDRATVAFSLDRPEQVRVTVYDALGREVAVLTDGSRSAGAHEVLWEARGLPAGLYVVCVAGETFSATERVARIP